MKIALLMLLSVAATGPALAEPTRGRLEPSSITCDTVRAYVAQVGLAQPERSLGQAA